MKLFMMKMAHFTRPESHMREMQRFSGMRVVKGNSKKTRYCTTLSLKYPA
jgi:hypothetical protein